MADITPPTIAITSNKTVFKAGDTALITFTLSEATTDFVLSDITVTGGTLSNFSGSGTKYSAIYTPTTNIEVSGGLSVGNFKFSDLSGNANIDGADADNRLSFAIDTIKPTAVIISQNSYLTFGQTSQITFQLSEPSKNFTVNSITVTGGILSNFNGSDKIYTATITPFLNSTKNIEIQIKEASFSDLNQNLNLLSNQLMIGIDTENPINGGPTLNWVKLFTAGDGNNGATYRDFGIVKDFEKLNDGGMVIAANVAGKNNNYPDVVLNKFDKNGSLVWQSFIKTDSDDTVSDIERTSDGGIIVVGQTWGNLTTGLAARNNGDAYVVKFNNNGVILWNKVFDGAGLGDKAISVTVDDKGNSFALIQGYNLFEDSQSSTGLFKFDINGNLLWKKSVGNSNDFAFKIESDINGSIYVHNYLSGINKFDGNGNIYGPVKFNNFGPSIFETDSKGGLIVIAYDWSNGNLILINQNSSGAEIWRSELAINDIGKHLAIFFTDILIGSNGDIYLTGNINRDNKVNDIIILKFDKFGQKSWSKVFGTEANDLVVGIIEGNNNEIFVAGTTTGNLFGNLNSGYDGYLAKLNFQDIAIPSVAISAVSTDLLIGSSTLINFALSKPSTNFTLSDITVQGGTLSNFQGSGTNYTATFTVGLYGERGASINIESGKFSDALQNFNEDGSDANNKVSFKVASPKFSLASSTASVNEGSTITVTLSATNVAAGFLIPYTISGINAGDISAGLLSGTVAVSSNGSATIKLDLTSDSLTEGIETLTLTAVDQSISILINDTSVDITPPSIWVSASKASLKAGEVATISFSLSESSTTFTVDDVKVEGGTLSNFSGSGVAYSALFKPNTNSILSGKIGVPSGVFTDTSGNANSDGSDYDNSIVIAIDTVFPTIELSSNKTNLIVGDSAIVTFILSEVSTNFVASDVMASGGTLTNFEGSGTTYTAIFTPTLNSNFTAVVSVTSGAFTDFAGNINSDGADKNNALNFTRLPTIQTETHSLSVIVDKNVLSASATLLKELKESITFTNGVITKHIVEYSGLTFDYNQIDSLITTVTRDGEFTPEFTKEINEYLKTELNIKYSAAVALVGITSIDGVILSVAGADGNFVG
jgi:hypothetical protein